MVGHGLRGRVRRRHGVALAGAGVGVVVVARRGGRNGRDGDGRGRRGVGRQRRRGEVGAGAALEVLGRRARGVGGGEYGGAEGAAELDGLGRHAGVGGRDEDGLEVRPVPGALALDRLRPHRQEAVVPLLRRRLLAAHWRRRLLLLGRRRRRRRHADRRARQKRKGADQPTNETIAGGLEKK
jgi:hypothetical protein